MTASPELPSAEPPGTSPQERSRRGRGRGKKTPVFVRVLGGVAVVGVVLLVGTGTVYLNRRHVAHEVLSGWLEDRGVTSELVIERADIDGFVGRVRLGDPQRPDLEVERIEVDYVIGMPWSRDGLGLKPGRVRLVRPRVRASWQEGKLSLGSLDDLIEELTSRPPQPDQPSPVILVEGGQLELRTVGGQAVIHGDARIEEGRLQRLSARMGRSSLGVDGFEGQDVIAALELTTLGDQMQLGLAGTAAALTTGEQKAEDVRFRIAALVPYPDPGKQHQAQRVWTRTRVQAGRGQLGATAGRDLLGQLAFEGTMTGPLDAVGLVGQLGGRINAGRLDSADNRFSGLAVSVADAALSLNLGQGTDPVWALQGPVRVTARNVDMPALAGTGVEVESGQIRLEGAGERSQVQGQVRVQADRLNSGDLALRQTRVAGRLEAVLSQGASGRFLGQAEVGSGAWSGLGPAKPDDIDELARLKQSLSDLSVKVPGLDVSWASGGYQVRLTEAATLRPRSGGQVVVEAGRQPLLSAGPGRAPAGAMLIRATLPDGLPSGRIEISHWSPVAGGFDVRLGADLDLDFGLARGLTIAGQGQLEGRGGRLQFQPTDCADLTVQTLELGESDIVDLTGLLCPERAPLFAMVEGRWQLRGQVKEVSGSAPFLAVSARQVSGRLEAFGGPTSLGMSLNGMQAAVIDTTAPVRFNPLALAGNVQLANEVWQGLFDVATAQGQPLGQMSLTHDGRTAEGRLQINASDLTFVEGGLQPQTLSPMSASFVASPVRGQADFQGQIGWKEGTDGNSSGQLHVTDLDFTSPAGPVRGLNGTVLFTSLVPLTTAPGQQLTARELETVVVLHDPVITFGLEASSMVVDGGEVQVGGGRLRIEPLTIPLQPDPTIQGAVVLENIQLGDLIAEAGFGNSVDMDALVSGRLPFVRNPDGSLRFSGGNLYAVRPGRLSIHREALSGLDASGGGEAAAPGVVEDLAYQAIEHLSFESLGADVDSQADGRLAVRFHINGAFSPPQHQELRLTYQELISRDFMNRPMTLPSGTQVKLTLDTTLNLDQLLQDLAEVARARRGN